MTTDIGATGELARVTYVEDGGSLVCFELRNGTSGTSHHGGQGDGEFTVGDVLLLIRDERGARFEAMPRELWPEETWAAVVKVKHPEVTVIDTGGRWRLVATSDQPSYEEGNTVEASLSAGILRVLAKSPIRYVETPGLDEKEIERFRREPGQDKELTFDHFGGLPEVVKRARELIEVPLEMHKELSDIGARAIKGVLFTGEPGTGKTMLARIIACQADAAFYQISGPEIFSKWYGQSEEVLRRLFEAAGKEEKAIIFFDEIDSVAAQRGDASHEASKRVVAQLLTLMDGFTADTNVVVIAATNRPQDLDVALRRPGRFDWEIEFPYPDGRDREDILRKTSQSLRTEGTLGHTSIARQTAGWSGAELVAIWSEAALLAVEDGRTTIREEDYLGGFQRVSRYRNRAAKTKPNEERG